LISWIQPLSYLYRGVTDFRNYLYDSNRIQAFKAPHAKVISIGNLTVGGTGKTPTIVWLADWLISHNLTPVVLTRGYKGQLENSSGLLKSGQKFRLNPFDYGDEPLMISNKMSRGAVIVGKKRAQNLMKYFHQVKPDVVLLDDGFQHLQIHRSFNILLFDATMSFSRYEVAPLGYLREGMSALKDADAIIISRADLVSTEVLDNLKNLLKKHYHHKLPIALTSYHPVGVFDVHDKYIYSTHELKGKKAIAVTAIASPESFYQNLVNFGIEIVEKVVPEASRVRST
jgi:tetraacyldisaccharide 4'-kinase